MQKNISSIKRYLTLSFCVALSFYLMLSTRDDGNPSPTPANSEPITIGQESASNTLGAAATNAINGAISSIKANNQVNAHYMGAYKTTHNITNSADSAAAEADATAVDTEDAENSADYSLVGDWKITPEATALGVGPSRGNTGWWSNTADHVHIRGCLFDDIFRFNSDGSFENIMGYQTWLEVWQAVEKDSCGAPVAPYNGSAAATYSYNKAAATLTISGAGAHIGLPKVINGGELPYTGAALVDSITYLVTELTDTTMTLDISIGTGWWRYQLVKEDAYMADTTAPVIRLVGPTSITIEQGSIFNAPRATAIDNIDGEISFRMVVDNPVDTDTVGTYKVTYSVTDSAGNAATPVIVTVNVSAVEAEKTRNTRNTGDTENNRDPPLVGDWKMIPEAVALGVGPSQGNTSWWSNSAGDVNTRSCFFDDIFRFNANGSFENIMGGETWLESWQGAGADSCGAPVAPHNGSAIATYSYNQAAGTLTVHGAGAHIGLPKVVNGVELSYTGAALVDSITYIVIELTDTTMTLDISIGAGWWRYKLIKEGTYISPAPSGRGDPIDSSKWHAQTLLPNGSSWFNSEQQHYTDRNTYLSDGSLKIVAKKEQFTQQEVTKSYTSARLNSKFAFTYGRVEVRAKLPTGYGTWPAIWLLGKNINERGAYWQTQGFGSTSWPACGEADLIEHWGANQNWVQSAIHTPSSSDNALNRGGQLIATASSEFHIYTLDWTAERMVFSVDGKTHYIYNPAVKNTDTWPFDSELYLLLNVAIESRIASDFNETQMEVDYVRIYDINAKPNDPPIWSDEFE